MSHVDPTPDAHDRSLEAPERRPLRTWLDPLLRLLLVGVAVGSMASNCRDLECALGMEIDSDECVPCADGTFSNTSTEGVCQPWTTCEPGTFVIEEGSQAADRRCGACPEGTTTTQENAEACVSLDGYIEVGVGRNSICAIRAVDGELDCWGTLAEAEDFPAGVSFDEIAVDVWGFSACGIRSDDHSLACWTADKSQEWKILTVPEGAFTDVSVEHGDGCAIREDTGDLICWGNRWYINDIDYGSGSGVVDLGAGFRSVDARYDYDRSDAATFVVHGDDEVRRYDTRRRFGFDYVFSLQFPRPIASVHSMERRVCALYDDGSVGCADGNFSPDPVRDMSPPFPLTHMSAFADGMCGVSEDSEGIVCMRRYHDHWRSIEFTMGRSYRRYSRGMERSCAIDISGQLHCWTLDGRRIMGSSMEPPAPLPVRLLSAGDGFTCASMQDEADLRCWGINSIRHGQISLPPSETELALLSSGAQHSCGIRSSDSSLVCWGNDMMGEVRDTPSTGEWAEVSVHTQVSCALDAEGAITCWGFDFFGVSSGYPAGTGFRDLHLGARHACAINAEDKAVCWGVNSSGEADPPDQTFAALALGYDHTCGIGLDDGLVTCWGSNDSRQSSNRPTVPVREIDAGLSSTCAILEGSDELQCWGTTFAGEDLAMVRLAPSGGPYESVTLSSTHGCVKRVEDEVPVCWGDHDMTGGISGRPTTEPHLDVALGVQHTCVLGSDRAVECWGTDFHGVIGDVPTTAGFVGLYGGPSHSCARTEDGQVACWGAGFHGQLVPEPPTTTFLRVDPGDLFTCGIRTDGSAYCWGDDSRGQVSGASEHEELVEIAAGRYHVCGVDLGGHIVCWGDSSNGRTDSPTGEGYRQLSSWFDHTCALREGSVACWGSDSRGQVSSAPTEGEFIAISAGKDHSCAIDLEGVVFCWGDDLYHQSSGAPKDQRFIRVFAGERRTCGQRDDGTVTCWGDQLWNPRATAPEE